MSELPSAPYVVAAIGILVPLAFGLFVRLTVLKTHLGNGELLRAIRGVVTELRQQSNRQQV